MTKETGVLILKTVLTFGGSYLVGDNLFGKTIDESTLQIFIGAAMAIWSMAWSFFDKSYTIESVQSLLRQVILLIGGLLVASGKLSEKSLETIVGAVLALVPPALSALSKKKAAMLQDHELHASELATLSSKKPNLHQS